MQSTITNKLAIIAASLVLLFGAAYTALAYEDLQIEIDIKNISTSVEVEYSDDGDIVVEEYTFKTTNLEKLYKLIAKELDIKVSEVKEAVEGEEEEEELSEDDEAMESIADAKVAIAASDEHIDSLDDESTSTIKELEEKLESAKDLLADAEVEFEAGNFEAAADLAEEAEKLAEEIYEAEEEEEDDEEEDDEDGEGEGKGKNKCDGNHPGGGFGVAKKCVDNEDYVINDKLAKKLDRFADFGKSTDRVELQGQLQELLLILIDLLQKQMLMQSN